MTILDQLASSMGRRDEVPNQELAKRLMKANDKIAIKELVENLDHKSKDIQSDCIKVLYEIGEQKPSLVAAYAMNFVELLDHKNNRLQWGAMTALDAITLEAPALVYGALAKVIETADKGSVITRDHAVNMLIKLCSFKQYINDTFPLLIEQLQICPTNQLPMYAENAIPVIHTSNKTKFIKTLSDRLDEIEKETKRKRVEKVIKKIS